MHTFRMMKVFAREDMPKSVLKEFLMDADGSFVRWTIITPTDEVSDWLMNNGAEMNETVLIAPWKDLGCIVRR